MNKIYMHTHTHEQDVCVRVYKHILELCGMMDYINDKGCPFGMSCIQSNSLSKGTESKLSCKIKLAVAKIWK